MSKTMKLLLAVGLFAFSVSAHAGITFDVTVAVNSAGNDIYTITANSDSVPITSLGINVVGDGILGQEYSILNKATHLTDNNDVLTALGNNPDTDTQALFHTIDDSLLIVAGFSDTAELYDINFTGFEPFTSRAIMQVVLTSNVATAVIGVVAGGVEYTILPPATYGQVSALNPPEPASMSLLAIASLTLIRRR